MAVPCKQLWLISLSSALNECWEAVHTCLQHAACPAGLLQVWSELDPHATHFIPAVQLSTLIQELRPPLGVKSEQGCTRAMVQGIIMHVDIPFRHGKVCADRTV